MRFELLGKEVSFGGRGWAGMRRVGDVAVPREFTALFGDDVGLLVELDVAVVDEEVDGREVPRICAVQARAKRADGSGLKSSDLRLPLTEMVEEATTAVALHVRETEPGAFRLTPSSSANDRALSAGEVGKVRRRRKITDEFLAEVANVARAFEGTDASEAIMAVFTVSRPQAFRYMKMAREAGYLEQKGARDD